MNNFLVINWLPAIPLGLLSLFFLFLGLRRGTLFFDHESDANSKERIRDIFLCVFDLASIGFCILLVVSPLEMWAAMVPFGLAMFVFVVPVSILGSYWQLHMVYNFMPKNRGIIVRRNSRGENTGKSLAWYEFVPFAFLIGWIVFFLVNLAIFSFSRLQGAVQENYGLGLFFGLAAGTLIGAIIVLGAFLKSKAA